MSAMNRLFVFSVFYIFFTEETKKTGFTAVYFGGFCAVIYTFYMYVLEISL